MLPNGPRHYLNEAGTDVVGAQSHVPPRALPNGLDPLPEGSQYPLQQQHGIQIVAQSQQLPLFDGTRDSLGASTSLMSQGGRAQINKPVRRRISRACDQCNHLRTKCDGEQPCAHCEEGGLTCEYARAKKKRGKASRKDSAAQQTEANVKAIEVKDSTANSAIKNEMRENVVETTQQMPHGIKRKRSGSEFQPPPAPPQGQIACQQGISDFAYRFPGPEQPGTATNGSANAFSIPRLSSAGMPAQIMQTMSGYEPIDVDDYQRGSLLPVSTCHLPKYVTQWSTTYAGFYDPDSKHGWLWRSPVWRCIAGQSPGHSDSSIHQRVTSIN